MKIAILISLFLIGCAKPMMPDLTHCEFQPGDMVRLISTGEVGPVVDIHRWDSDWCLSDVLLGEWIVEDIRTDRLEHVN